MSFFKLLRIVILMTVLIILVAGAWMTERRLANWERPIWVTLYPIVATQDRATLDYVRSIHPRDFDEINAFLRRELGLYGVALETPLRFQLAPPAEELPPAIPDRNSPAAVAIWSLKMRWWAWVRRKPEHLLEPDIQMFLLYHGVGEPSEMQMSVGMRKGRYGLVKAYSGSRYRSRNNVVITHELLHVLGATDKYAFGTGAPIYPDGFADPGREPLFPQQQAEIMGGAIPLSANDFVQPQSLREVRIGRRTAEEIGLFDQLRLN